MSAPSSYRRSSGSPAGTTLSSLQRSKASCFSGRRPRPLLGDRDRGGPRRARQVSHQLNSSQGNKSCCSSGSPRPRSPVGGPPHQAMTCNQPKCGKESHAATPQVLSQYLLGQQLMQHFRWHCEGPETKENPFKLARYYINHLSLGSISIWKPLHHQTPPQVPQY